MGRKDFNSKVSELLIFLCHRFSNEIQQSFTIHEWGKLAVRPSYPQIFRPSALPVPIIVFIGQAGVSTASR